MHACAHTHTLYTPCTYTLTLTNQRLPLSFVCYGNLINVQQLNEVIVVVIVETLYQTTLTP